jgi:signal transduction histidine kinase
LRTRSIFKRLAIGLVLVGVLGAVALFVFVVIEYGISSQARRDEIGFSGIAREIVDHVVFPLVVLIVPMAIAASWVIRSSLAPLKVAAANIERAKTADRGFRVDASEFPAEAEGFANAMNGLLARLDDTAARQEAFAADVAHELRTPLSILSLELSRLGSSDAARLKKDVAGMSRLVEQLLVLAQLDAQAAARAPLEVVVLADVASELVAQFASIAVDAGKEMALDVQATPSIRCHKEVVAAALRNLVENALRVTPTNGVVTVVVGPGPVLRVQDGGPGVSHEALAVFRERLRRGDHASGSGAGLGLAIVSRIMEAQGGALRTSPERTEMVLDFNPSPRAAS